MFQFPNFQNVSIFLVKKKLEFFKPLNSIFLNLKYVNFKRKTDIPFEIYPKSVQISVQIIRLHGLKRKKGILRNIK